MATEEPPQPTVYKRRRLQVRCDSANMPNNRCSNCIAFNSECTHSNVRKRSGPYTIPSTSKRESPSDASSPRLSPQLQALSPSTVAVHPLIQPLLSSLSLDSSTHHSLITVSNHIYQLEQEISNLKQAGAGSTTASSSRDSSSSPQVTSRVMMEERRPPPPPPIQSSTSNRNDEIHLSSQLKRMVVSDSQQRHFGPSSAVSLLGVALQVGKEKNKVPLPDDNYHFRRPEYWMVHPWEHVPEEPAATYEFPDRDLMHELVGLYFDHVNVHFPMLHRPTFVKDVIDGLYLRDHNFGATVLGVCAIASRYSNNPAVLLEGNNSRLASGWKWYVQIRQFWRSTSRVPSLHNIQTICLSIIYTHGTSQPEACWVMVGIGIRIAQDVGAHRKRFMEKQSIESELWKRCFWVLVCIDALVCSFLGRPRATISFDYDLDLPIDCDDEYWETEDPSLAFHQPPGQPSKISSFITYIKLMGILEFAQRFLYSVNRKGKGCPSRGHAQSSDEEVVSRLDSRLNEWFEDIPDHLKWTSCTPGSVFYAQSAMLHSCYYHVRILVHRPFIPLPKKPSPLPFPSLAICTNAARSCAHLMKTYSDNGAFLPFPQVQFAIYTSAILLLVGHWTNSKPGAPRDSNNEDLKRVKDCASVLSKLESRWTPAGRFGDVIQEIASYPEAQCTLNHNQNPATDGNAVAAPGNSQSQGLQAPGYQPPFSWGSEVPPKPQGWNLSAQKVPDATHVGSVNEEQWWEGLNPVQFDFTPLGPSPYAHTLRLPTSENPGTYPQWSFMPQDVTMEVGDVAMLWLQQSQMSEYVSVHPCEDLSNAQ